MRLSEKKKIIVKIGAGIMSLFLIVGIAAPAHAYTTTGAYIVNKINFIPSSSFGSATIKAFNDALYPWNAASGRSLMSRSATTTHNSLVYPQDDGRSYIYKTYAYNDYVAQCTWYSDAGVTTSADININPYYAWANSAQPGSYDVWSVFMHEAGHAAGLYHSNLRAAVMYGTVYTNELKRSLHSDDIAGIQAIY